MQMRDLALLSYGQIHGFKTSTPQTTNHLFHIQVDNHTRLEVEAITLKSLVPDTGRNNKIHSTVRIQEVATQVLGLTPLAPEQTKAREPAMSLEEDQLRMDKQLTTIS